MLASWDVGRSRSIRRRRYCRFGFTDERRVLVKGLAVTLDNASYWCILGNSQHRLALRSNDFMNNTVSCQPLTSERCSGFGMVRDWQQEVDLTIRAGGQFIQRFDKPA